MASERANRPFLEVNGIKLKPRYEPEGTFVDVMQRVTAAAEKTHWHYHYTISAVRDTPRRKAIRYSVAVADRRPVATN
ncbi:hypothetical protein GCM10027065_26930 [Rhodanobacter koreensis]